MKPSFWTHDLRKRVFSRLKVEFGPHCGWGATRYPRGQVAKYKAVLAELSREISSDLGRQVKAAAIAQQVDWGITKQVPMRDQARVRNFILNKAAALESALITTSDLPDLLTAA